MAENLKFTVFRDVAQCDLIDEYRYLGSFIFRVSRNVGTYHFYYYAPYKNCENNAISFVMSVRPFVVLVVRMEQLGFHWTDFDEI